MDAQAVEKALRNMPWWGYAVAGGVALGGVAYVRKHSSGAQSVKAQPEQQVPDGLSSADLAGLPFDYYDYSASVDPNASQTPGTSGGTVTTGNPSPSGGVVYPAPPAHFGGPGGQPPTGGQPTGNPAPAVYHHTVEAWPAWDSTLGGIASHYGMSWDQLYTYGNDKSIIDSAAHAHGHYSQEYNWLFPGEQLEVPSPN